MRNTLVLDSKFRTNPEDKEHVYKFKLNTKMIINGSIRLEQFIFQNSQYVFSQEKRSNKFIYTEDDVPTTITFEGMYDNADTFIKQLNIVLTSLSLPIRITYSNVLYEFKIQHLQGHIFSLEEYYTDGNFMDLIGFKRCMQGANVYTNVNVPKLFAQRPIYISIPEIGTYSTMTRGMKPYTFLVLSKPGFEIVSNINNTFNNEFNVKDKELDELTIRIHDSDGLPFANNKGNANFIIILNY